MGGGWGQFPRQLCPSLLPNCPALRLWRVCTSSWKLLWAVRDHTALIAQTDVGEEKQDMGKCRWCWGAVGHWDSSGRFWLIWGSKHVHGLQGAISESCLNSSSASELHDSSSLILLLWVKRALIILPLPPARAVLNTLCKSLASFIH